MVVLNKVEPYKSFNNDPLSIEINNLTIITGENGAGKTQLLEAIGEHKIHLLEDGSRLEEILYIHGTNLKPNDLNYLSIEQIRTERTQLEAHHRMSHDSGSFSAFLTYCRKPIETRVRDSQMSATTGIFTFKKYDVIIDKAVETFRRDIAEIADDDLRDVFYYEYNRHSSSVFVQNYTKAFVHYASLLEDNQYAIYRYERFGVISKKLLNEAEFYSLYGEAPWIFINKALVEIGFSYQFTPPPANLDRYTPFLPHLVDINTKVSINMDSLSSGEKVLMSILIARYNISLGAKPPKVILLDEPDASLHPSMVDKFIKIVNDIFVVQYGTKVIITTHSPTTVALAPEESIFIMNRSGERLRKASKDEALSYLTKGLHTLTVSYENRKQVFVEGKNDLVFYEAIYGKLKASLNNDISLNFIQSGFGAEGNCTQVIDIVNNLVRLGNTKIYGIIDWDTRNEKFATDRVKVSGIGKRYSIENYILDPLLIMALLIREKKLTRDAIKMGPNDTYISFGEYENEKLQQIANLFLATLKTHVLNIEEEIRATFDFNNEECLDVEYLNGKVISLPVWFLHHQGHFLEDCIKGAYVTLRQFNHVGLKKTILDKVIDDIPGLISSDLLALFTSLQED